MVMSRLRFYMFFLLLLRLVAAQDRDLDDSEEGRGFSPTMAIVMIVLVSVFFALGCFSVYMRRCLEQALGVDRSDPGNWLNVRQTTARGLDASVIETFPTFRYSTVKTLRIGGKEALECPVCLNEFEDDETLRLIPQCCHVFHPGCIDAWLRTQATCPLCRTNLIPVPGESVSYEIPGLTRETGQNSPGTIINETRLRVLGSPDMRLIDSVVGIGNQSMPRKSMSTGWKLAELCRQSSLTDQTEENLDRFTLRLPQEIHNQLVNSSVGNQESKAQVVELPQVRSSIRGYRTGSLGTERNYFYFERFEEDGRFDRRPFSITPPYRTGPIRSPDVDSNHERSGPPKGLLLAIRSPFDRLFTGKYNVGERSYLRSGDASPV